MAGTGPLNVVNAAAQAAQAAAEAARRAAEAAARAAAQAAAKAAAEAAAQAITQAAAQAQDTAAFSKLAEAPADAPMPFETGGGLQAENKDLCLATDILNSLDPAVLAAGGASLANATLQGTSPNGYYEGELNGKPIRVSETNKNAVDTQYPLPDPAAPQYADNPEAYEQDKAAVEQRRQEVYLQVAVTEEIAAPADYIFGAAGGGDVAVQRGDSNDLGVVNEATGEVYTDVHAQGIPFDRAPGVAAKYGANMYDPNTQTPADMETMAQGPNGVSVPIVNQETGEYHMVQVRQGPDGELYARDPATGQIGPLSDLPEGYEVATDVPPGSEVGEDGGFGVAWGEAPAEVVWW